MEPSNLKILTGFPSGEFIHAPWLGWYFRFFDRTRHGVSMPLLGEQAGRIDLARSYFIDEGKRLRQYDWLITLDQGCRVRDSSDDARPEIPAQTLDTLVDRLERARIIYGFDVVAGTTVDQQGLPIFGATPDRLLEVDGQTPFEVEWSSCGLLAISRNALDRVRPNGTITGRGGLKPKPQNLYCRMSPEWTEDFDLFQNFKKCGVKTGLDPGIITTKDRNFGAAVDPEYWTRLRDEAIHAHEARVKRLGTEA